MIDVALRHEPLPKPVIGECFFAGEACHGMSWDVMGMSCYVMLYIVNGCCFMLFWYVPVFKKTRSIFFTSNQIRTIAEAVRHASKALAKFFSVDAIPDVHEKCPTAQSRC